MTAHGTFEYLAIAIRDSKIEPAIKACAPVAAVESVLKGVPVVREEQADLEELLLISRVNRLREVLNAIV